MPRLKELLIELDQELSSRHFTESENAGYRELITVALMDNGWLHLLKSGVRAGVRVKSKKRQGVTQADILIELMKSIADEGDTEVARLLGVINGN
ncbi:MAG: hypothetical protein JKY52_09400 [Flavobacteriales bacterium]|nr:hypothetical protein [Flavobacteriales bacterium]